MTLLADEKIQDKLEQLPGWQISEGQLENTFKLRSFAHAVIFVGAIAQLAEAANHHPDLNIFGYNKVTVSLSTHSAGGLTEKDFALAEGIQALPHREPK